MITLDFGGTVYNTTAQHQKFHQIFAKSGLDFDTIYETVSKHRPFCLDGLKGLKIEEKTKRELLSAITREVESGERYIYPDAKKFIITHDGRLNLLSFGDEKMQSARIDGAKIRKFFKNIVITQKEKYLCWNLLSRSVAYVDNDRSTVMSMKKHYANLKVYCLDRGGTMPPASRGVKKINNLSDIEEI